MACLDGIKDGDYRMTEIIDVHLFARGMRRMFFTALVTGVSLGLMASSAVIILGTQLWSIGVLVVGVSIAFASGVLLIVSWISNAQWADMLRASIEE